MAATQTGGRPRGWAFAAHLEDKLYTLYLNTLYFAAHLEDALETAALAVVERLGGLEVGERRYGGRVGVGDPLHRHDEVLEPRV